MSAMFAASVVVLAFSGGHPPAVPAIHLRPADAGLTRDGASTRIGQTPGTAPLLGRQGQRRVGDLTAVASSSEPSQAMLRATAFTFVVGLSLTTLTPAPYLVDSLGQVAGMKLLTALATTSAVTEIALSPVVGGMSDSMGRKPILIATLVTALLANAVAAVFPAVATVALAKFVGGAVVGIFFLAAGAILADEFRTEPKKLAAASGILFALVNAGFGVGIALSGLLPPGLRARYVCSSAVCLAGTLIAASGVRESMPASDRIPFKARAFNPFAFTRLLRAGSAGSGARHTMQLLVSLAALTLLPLFMGDTLQVFAISHWALTNAQVAQLFTFVSVSGVVANLLGGKLIQKLGLKTFTAIATASNLLLWLGFGSGSLKLALLGAGVGFLGPARTLGATTMMTSEGAKLGIPQGQLSGDRANLIAWLKVLGPLIYGWLYVRGVSVGFPQAPFVLNVLLTAAALFLGPVALTARSVPEK
jgi:DHA1 family tetracycline resistance protein-like MFS transporter